MRPRGHHEIERLGRRDQDVRRLAEHRLAVLLRCVAGAKAHSDRRADALQRCSQVAVDVVAQRLQRRDVDRRTPCPSASGSSGGVRIGRRAARESVDPPQERRQCLTRARGRADQRVVAEAIAGQPLSWAGVGASNEASNQRRTGSENGSRGVVFAVDFDAMSNRLSLRGGPYGLVALSVRSAHTEGVMAYQGKLSSISARVGASWSRSESLRCWIGHSTPMSGSSQRMPASVSGSYVARELVGDVRLFGHHAEAVARSRRGRTAGGGSRRSVGRPPSAGRSVSRAAGPRRRPRSRRERSARALPGRGGAGSEGRAGCRPRAREWFSCTKRRVDPVLAPDGLRETSRRGSRARRRAPSTSSRTRSGISVSIRVELTRAACRTALVVLAVLARADRLPPALVLPVPVDDAGDPLVEATPAPSSRALRLLRAERVAAVVARAVRDVLDQRLVAAGQLEDRASRRRCSRARRARRRCRPRPARRARARCRSPRRSPRPRASCGPACRRRRRAADRRRAR